MVDYADSRFRNSSRSNESTVPGVSSIRWSSPFDGSKMEIDEQRTVWPCEH